MANDDIKEKEENTSKTKTLENGTYEIIKNRLDEHGKILKDRLNQLNGSRKDVFGSIENTLLGSERIITRNNCVPRDMVPVGNDFIFGYNVHMGLKSTVAIDDVLAVYHYKDNQFKEAAGDCFKNKKFVTDFQELYKYYKSTFFTKFLVIEPYLYMIFQVGKSSSDIKTFKWLIEGDSLKYIDNRSDHEVRFPPQHDFEWKRCKRDSHRYGLHPHISIEDRVFVETIEGDLTIKVEDNTDTGKGLYAEDVDNPDQTLDDAETYYACVGNLILLKIRPYQENDFRYFVFNEKIQEVYRIDTIENSCILLPDGHGLIFPDGYYLQSGQFKKFDIDLGRMYFEQRIASSNGEDYLYIFYNKKTGVYLLLSYNLISQSVEVPMPCTGFSHFEDGQMLLFKTEEEPRKNHVVQIWQTPFVGRDYIPEAVSESMLFKIGNQEVVRSMAQCQAIINLIRKEDPYVSLYVDMEKETSDILDTYFWLDKEEAFNIKEILGLIRNAASSAVEEYEKVSRIKVSTRKQIDDVGERTAKLFKDISYSSFDKIDDYVNSLARLREIRGEIISLKDLRYTDLPLIDTMEKEGKERNEEFAGKCVEFLLKPEGLAPYRERVQKQYDAVPEVQKGAEGKTLDEEIGETSKELELLIDIVGNLKIDDPTQTTEIIDRISSIYSNLNQAKSKLKNRLKELRSSEGEAEFHAQLKLIDQAVVNYLDVADSPQKCEEYLTKLMVQVEELEGKFTDFEKFIILLTEKREELYSAFESRKLAIMEKRNKKANALLNASERIIKGIKNRLETFDTINEINGYFATDLMVEKVRDIVDQLLEIGDSVKADDIQGQIKTVKEDAVRQLKDKQDLFLEGKDIIKFGNHHFTVNTQHLDLSLVQKDEGLFFHMTGTDFWQKADVPGLDDLRSVWDQEAVSENRDVYRGEYLAYKMLENTVAEGYGKLEQFGKLKEEELREHVRAFMAPRYKEGYTKGLHDFDGAALLKPLLTLHLSLDLLIYDPNARALAALYWMHDFGDKDKKDRINSRLKGLNRVSKFFKSRENLNDFVQVVETQLETFVESTGLFSTHWIPEAAQYLCREIMRADTFVISAEAAEIIDGFTNMLKFKKADIQFAHSLRDMAQDLAGAYYLTREWVLAYFDEKKDVPQENRKFIPEAVVLLMTDSFALNRVIPVKTTVFVNGLHGDHSLIEKGTYKLSYTFFSEKLKQFDTLTVPRFVRYQELKKEIAAEFKSKLRLEEFKSRVLSSFVRNKLIDKVYLPLIGDNLAKQMGVAGEGKRTDLMGMLLLISPPGYGKTTLMEYIADRLGIIFVKVNGPSIGHGVTSMDPAEARNASAKEELKKLNLALEMGNNIMIYLDDIQHCNPEFLQKFISLCDAQRKIEGIYNGVARTYDLRGKKVAVVMAGNPYTESGEKFQIPDMLANRADVYNLGDMLKENEHAFKLSYIENSLTSNPVLNKLVTRSRNDVYTLIEAAVDGNIDNLELEGNYSNEEIDEFINVIEKLVRVRDVVLKSNLEYIRSAAMADEYRTEPPFKLQGSYRNMNKIAEKILPVMNEHELEMQIETSYENDAQTLATGAEANMLKWKEIAGRLDDTDKARWLEIKSLFSKNKLVKGDDKIGQAVLQLNQLGEGLSNIEEAITRGITGSTDKGPIKDLMKGLAGLQKVIETGFKQYGTDGIEEVIRSGFKEYTESVGKFASEPQETSGTSTNEALVSVLKDPKGVLASGGAVPV
ncbi:MAG: AAA family ATPase, partial [bacterium]|nr:AAA family ATPase [bacterium]